jgi:uncharacterized protein
VRNLLLFILVLVAIWWVRRALRNLHGGAGPGAAGDKRQRAPDQIEPMLACTQCGVHVPESEGVRDGDAFYCCEEHRRQAARH